MDRSKKDVSQKKLPSIMLLMMVLAHRINYRLSRYEGNFLRDTFHDEYHSCEYQGGHWDPRARESSSSNPSFFFNTVRETPDRYQIYNYRSTRPNIFFSFRRQSFFHIQIRFLFTLVKSQIHDFQVLLAQKTNTFIFFMKSQKNDQILRYLNKFCTFDVIPFYFVWWSLAATSSTGNTIY